MARAPAHFCSPYRGTVLTCLLLFACILTFSTCARLPQLQDAIAESCPREECLSSQQALPPEKVEAIIRRLEKRVGRTEILQRHITIMKELSTLPLVEGNKATLLVDGPATYRAMEKAIQSARDHINFETFIFADDEEGRRFADLFLRKQAEGVQVNLMYDSVGCLNTPAAFFQRLRDGGIQTLAVGLFEAGYGSAESLINRDHRKIMIVDGKIAFTGGINVSGVYARSSFAFHPQKHKSLSWRDTDVQIEGPAVAEFQRLFMEMWRRQKGPPLDDRNNYFPSLEPIGHDLVRVVGSEPGDENRLTYLMYVSAITFASKSVHLTNAYFAPDKQTRDAFQNAAGRGVDVKLVLPSTSDMPLVLYAGRSYYEDLLEAGVKVYERREAMLHAKTAVIDGVWSTVGSTNMDLWSFLRNYEVNAVILSADFASQMEALFSKDLHMSNEIVPEEWRSRSFSERLKERFARFIRYWL